MTEKDLPSYRRPPVIEVVCGVQFEELGSFSSVHYGKLWSRLASAYPRTEDRDPLAEVVEGPRGALVRGELAPLNLPPLRRVFYISEDENYLLQVQPTRFLANWRRRREGDEYPRFSAAYGRFLKGWGEFLAFLQAEKLVAPKVNQYELTYINHIFEATTPFPVGIQEQLGAFSWHAAQTIKFLPTPRGVNFDLHFALPDGKGALHVITKHGIQGPDRKGIMMTELTARGPGKNDASDMNAWFGLAHEWIVRGFTDLTTAEAHKRWEREK